MGVISWSLKFRRDIWTTDRVLLSGIGVHMETKALGKVQRERTKKKERERERSKERTLIINSISETLQGRGHFQESKRTGQKRKKK